MMKRVVSAVLAALLLASVSRAEEAAVDAAALEAMPGCEVFLDENGVDTVIRPAGQPFAGVAAGQDCELYAYLDGVEKPDEGAVFLRLTVALMTPEAVDAREMTLDAGGGSYVFKVTADTGEYDAMYYEDYAVCLTDESLPLTPPEWPEWGNPLNDALAYDRILAYSPYDQVAARPYPPLLITGGLTDPRVTYWEPAKWAARLRHEAPDAGPYFLKINMDAGHGGASGRFASMRETALEYAFALAAVGRASPGEGFQR